MISFERVIVAEGVSDEMKAQTGTTTGLMVVAWAGGRVSVIDVGVGWLAGEFAVADSCGA